MRRQPEFARRLERATGPLGKLPVVLSAVAAIPFVLFGLFVAGKGIQQWNSGQQEGIFFALFGVVFAGIGVGSVVYTARRRHKLHDVAAQLEQTQDRPWLLNPNWASGRISGSNRAAMLAGWGIGIVWCLVSSPVLFAIPKELAKGNTLVLLALVFPLIGLGLLGWAATMTTRYWRYGRSSLEMNTLPGVLGGEIRATLVSQKPLPHDAMVRITLRNIRRTTSGSGKNRSTTERVLWEDSIDVPSAGMTLRPDGYGLALQLQIPFDAKASDPLASNDCTLWRLLAHADLRGADFSAQFDVPVFETHESDSSLTSGTLSRKRNAGLPLLGSEVALSAGIEVCPSAAGGIEIYFPPARNKAAACTVTLLGGIFGAATWLLISHAPIFFTCVFGLAPLALLIASFNMWFGSMRISASAQGVGVTKKLLGIGRRHFIAREEIESLAINSGMRSGSTTYWDVRLRRKAKSSTIVNVMGIRIAPSIRERRDAERLLTRLEDVLGL